MLGIGKRCRAGEGEGRVLLESNYMRLELCRDEELGCGPGDLTSRKIGFERSLERGKSRTGGSSAAVPQCSDADGEKLDFMVV